MAALETIRTKFGIGASLIIAFGLLLFLVNPSDIIQTIQSASSKYDVGKINGKSISYTDFDQLVKQNSDINQMLTGVSTSSEDAQKQMREQTWQNLVQDYLVIPTIQKAGINVGQQEQIDLFVGDNISPVIVNSGLFRDENGNISSAMVRDFMEMASSDENPQYRLIRNYLQNLVRISRYQVQQPVHRFQLRECPATQEVHLGEQHPGQRGFRGIPQHVLPHGYRHRYLIGRYQEVLQ